MASRLQKVRKVVYKLKAHSNSGFTLAELLIVIVILGILGGIALPRFLPQAERGRVAEAVAMLSAIRKGQEAYKLEKNEYLGITETDDSTATRKKWGYLGISNPNTTDAKSRNFEYTINFANFPSYGGFLVTARRCGSQSWCRSPGGDNAGKIIVLGQDGQWCNSAAVGTAGHPNCPTN